MAKASAIEMQHAEAVKGINEKLERIETMLTSGGAALEVDGEDGWIVTNEEMNGLIEAVKNLSAKAGVDLMPADTTDPLPHLVAQIGLVSDRFSPIEHQGVNTPQHDQLRPPVEAGTTHDLGPTADKAPDKPDDKPAASGKNK